MTLINQESLDWTKLILEGFSPFTMKGINHAFSLLFPLEAMFECYVARVLNSQLSKGFKLKTQIKSQLLVIFDRGSIFN